MSVFGVKFGNSKIKAAPPKIRIEKAAVVKKLEPLPSHGRVHSRPTSREPAKRNGDERQMVKVKVEGRARLETPDRKRKAVRQLSPGQLFDSSSDEEEEKFEDKPTQFAEKKQKPDLERRLRSRKAFSGEDGGRLTMKHAADVIDLGKKSSLSLAETVMVEFKYPSASQLERYTLVFGNDQINPADEIYKVANIVSNFYLSPAQNKAFRDQDTGVVRRLERAKNLLLKDTRNRDRLLGFKEAVNAYNKELETIIKTSGVAERLDECHHLPKEMIGCLLKQVYDRVVSPSVDFLKKKTENKDNTYGELHYPFVSEIIEQTGLKSNHVFVDLGSGVGNVVLQTALEVGCESWGCEMMETASKVAKEQKTEFRARCRLWGIKPGHVDLVHGDFREEPKIIGAMKRADVILVNNEVFGPDLNESLKLMFLDVKDGCKVVSLKSFGPADNNSRNENDSFNQFRVEQKQYYNGFVSWKDAGGSYFIATKDVRGWKR